VLFSIFLSFFRFRKMFLRVLHIKLFIIFVSTINLLSAQSGAEVEVTILPGSPKCGGRKEGFFRLLPKKGTPPIQYVWSCPACPATGSGNINQVPLPIDIENLSAGKYSFTFTDATGKVLTESAELTEPDPIDIKLNVQGDKCFGQNFGKVVIESVKGGVPPYLYAFNNGAPDTQTSWNNLASGQYFLEVIDAANCIQKAGIVLPLGVSFIFNLGRDTTIFSGDTIRLLPTASRSLYSLTLEPRAFTAPDSNGYTLLFPAGNTTFRAIATDSNGCEATDRLNVRVRTKRTVYGPNIFAITATNPDNAAFTLSGSGGIETISRLRIYDRIGRVWFDQRNFPINDNTNGWRGTYNGDLAPAGVYVWVAEVQYTNGRSDVFTGDVTLLR
jgi:hypothetical protein